MSFPHQAGVTIATLFASAVAEVRRARELRVQAQLAMIEAADNHARIFYGRGRSDRVAGLPMSEAFKFDPYYRRAYQTEAAKEFTK